MPKKGKILYHLDDASPNKRAFKTTSTTTTEFYSQVIDGLLDYANLITNSWNTGAAGIFQHESGEIRTESKDQKGASFFISLPDENITIADEEERQELLMKNRNNETEI